MLSKNLKYCKWLFSFKLVKSSEYLCGPQDRLLQGMKNEEHLAFHDVGTFKKSDKKGFKLESCSELFNIKPYKLTNLYTEKAVGRSVTLLAICSCCQEQTNENP